MKNIAKLLVKDLKNNGFIVLRYDSYSTNSIYLKLDYGLSHSVRISDHTGKSGLSYRFNVLTSIEKSFSEHGEKERHYYCKDDVSKLIQDILDHRDNQIAKYGFKGYANFMKKNKLENADKKGFWKQAVLV